MATAAPEPRTVAELAQRLSTNLITDAARRHGQLRVVSVACCGCTNDPALAAEIAAHRGAAKLGLRQLAPTVLAGTEPPATTLPLLRAAGQSPVQQSPRGRPWWSGWSPGGHRSRPAPAGPRCPPTLAGGCSASSLRRSFEWPRPGSGNVGARPGDKAPYWRS